MIKGEEVRLMTTNTANTHLISSCDFIELLKISLHVLKFSNNIYTGQGISFASYHKYPASNYACVDVHIL